MNMNHEKLIKSVLQAYFHDFLYLFYPYVAESLDFETVRFLDKELSTDITVGSLPEEDVVAEIRTRERSPKIVMLYIKIQAEWREAVAEQVFQDFNILWLTYQVPIVPITVYLRGGREGLAEEEYILSHVIKEYLWFRYHSARLAALPAEEYLKKGTPLGAALAALMDRSQAEDPLSLRASMLQQVAESREDDARKLLLMKVIETYFELTAEQKECFSRLLSKKEYHEARGLVRKWANKVS